VKIAARDVGKIAERVEGASIPYLHDF
jgi:hypothetical protein